VEQRKCTRLTKDGKLARRYKAIVKAALLIAALHCTSANAVLSEELAANSSSEVRALLIETMKQKRNLWFADAPARNREYDISTYLCATVTSEALNAIRHQGDLRIEHEVIDIGQSVVPDGTVKWKIFGQQSILDSEYILVWIAPNYCLAQYRRSI
jgi:hypothetical protein